MVGVDKPELLPLDEQEQWNEDFSEAVRLGKLKLPSKEVMLGLMGQNEARGLEVGQETPREYDLVKRVMKRHGFTEEKAIEILIAFGM